MEVIRNKDNGDDLESAVIGEWMETFIRQRDGNKCCICGEAASTKSPLIVERKDPSMPSRAANLQLCHFDCYHEHQARAREQDLRLRPDTFTSLRQPQQKRPKYWTVGRVLALSVLLAELAICYGCYVVVT